MELTVALDLSFQTVEQIALELRNVAATQASHVDMIALRPSLVIMFLALHMHQIEFIHEALAFEKVERAVHRDPIDGGIELARLAQNLAGIEMLFGGFNY